MSETSQENQASFVYSRPELTILRFTSTSVMAESVAGGGSSGSNQGDGNPLINGF